MESTAESPNSNSGTEPRTIDKLFELLSNRRRRYLLYYLWQTDGEAEIGPLSEQIAAWENDTPVEQVTSKERKCVYTALQQFHLEKLDQYDVVDFDKRDGSIELGDAADEMKSYLDGIEESDTVDGPTGSESDTPLYLSVLGIAVASLGALFSVVGFPVALVAASVLLALALGGLSLTIADNPAVS